jgi:RNA polymerase-binding transcription factor DksA
MPDEMERVQELNDAHVADSLQRHAERVARVARPGRTHCVESNCGEPIGAERTRQGAQRCDECEEEHAKRNAHFATWARR